MTCTGGVTVGRPLRPESPLERHFFVDMLVAAAPQAALRGRKQNRWPSRHVPAITATNGLHLSDARRRTVAGAASLGVKPDGRIAQYCTTVRFSVSPPKAEKPLRHGEWKTIETAVQSGVGSPTENGTYMFCRDATKIDKPHFVVKQRRAALTGVQAHFGR